MPESASPQELRQAFRSLSKRYHPDTTTLPGPQAEEAFRRLQQAYAVLADPQARQAYDDQLRRETAGRSQSALPSPPQPPVRSRPVSVRRALSGGEWFALLLLALALVLSLVLGIGVAWVRGVELVQRPSWWGQLQPPAQPIAQPPASEPIEGPADRPVAVGQLGVVDAERRQQVDHLAEGP